MAELYLHLFCWTGLSRLLVVCITYIMKRHWALSTEISSLETVSIFMLSSLFCPCWICSERNGGIVYSGILCFFLHTSRIQEDNCFAHMTTVNPIVNFSCSLCFNDDWVEAFGNCFARKSMMSLSPDLPQNISQFLSAVGDFSLGGFVLKFAVVQAIVFSSWKQNSREYEWLGDIVQRYSPWNLQSK